MELTIDSYLNSDPDYTEQIEKLLLSFKNNPKNDELLRYLSEPNVFDTLGKGRDEMTHSRILADILGGSMFSPNNNAPIYRLLDLLVAKASEQDVDVDKEMRASVLTSSLQMTKCVDAKTEYTLSQYLKDYANKPQSTSAERIDVYLRFDIAGTGQYGKHTVELFVENKVDSCEHDNQTQSYYDQCADGRRAAQLFIYLTTNAEDKCAALDRNGKPAFIHITYQDLMDKVFMPLLDAGSLNARNQYLLKEYVNCLELPALTQEKHASYSIMAISGYEKRLVEEFISDASNRRIINLAVHSTLGDKLYSYFLYDLLPFDDAVEKMLSALSKAKGMLHTLKSLDDVCGQQKGGTPFVINVIKTEKDKLTYLPTSLYEYQGQAFVSISEALINALSDYSARSGITDKAELINLFQPLYGRQKGGKSALVTSNHKDFKAWTEGYMPTEFDDLYIRREIRYDKLELINRVLGDGHHIKLISEDCYNNLVCPATDMQKEANANLYSPVEGTSIYFRKGLEGRIDEINEKSGLRIAECKLTDNNEQLLKRFYDNNRKLFLSVYRVLAEGELNAETKSRLLRNFKKLQKA